MAWGKSRGLWSNVLPGRDAWLIARRSLNDPEEIAYYLSNAPTDMPLLKMAQVAAQRCTVERCIEEAKGETGLDDQSTSLAELAATYHTLDDGPHLVGSCTLQSQPGKGGRA